MRSCRAAATGTGLSNYSISYVNGSLAVSQASSLAVTAPLVVTSASNLADGCNLTVGSFPAAPIVPAATIALASTSVPSPVVVPDPIITRSVSEAADRPPIAFISGNEIAASVFGSGDKWYDKASAIAALDAVLTDYGQLGLVSMQLDKLWRESGLASESRLAELYFNAWAPGRPQAHA